MSEIYRQLSFGIPETEAMSVPGKIRKEGLGNHNVLHQVIFEGIEEYSAFTDYAFNVFGGEGLSFTLAPFENSWRVREDVLKDALEQGFTPRYLTQEDWDRLKEESNGRQPFDPRNLDGLYVPGKYSREWLEEIGGWHGYLARKQEAMHSS